MSRMTESTAECSDCSKDLFADVIVPRVGDIGEFEVRRALPTRRRQMVGPFIFFDQMGPGEFLHGQGVDVRPHPHIGLSTLTFLFRGTLDHRDSLGVHQEISPGQVNLMTAGSGIVHSERTGNERRNAPSKLYGLQTWLALPKSHEEVDACFDHYTKAALPRLLDAGVEIDVIMGEFQQHRSPVDFPSHALYLNVSLRKGKAIPLDLLAEERAIYLLEGSIKISGNVFGSGQMLVLRPGDQLKLEAVEDSHLVILGGESADGPRHIWWNFVSSSEKRLEEAKQRWKEKRFPVIPGDSKEFTPLPQHS